MLKKPTLPDEQIISRLCVERTGLEAVAASRGHFVYESGHHGDLWLELNDLFVDTRRVQGWAASLAEQVVRCQPEFVCGPLTGGAFVAQSLAAELGAGFIFAERLVSQTGGVQYHIPKSLRGILSGKRVLLVDDAVNAGSALLSTVTDLQACGGKLVGFATLLTLGEAASQIAKQQDVPFFTLAALQREMWTAENVPYVGWGNH